MRADHRRPILLAAALAVLSATAAPGPAAAAAKAPAPRATTQQVAMIDDAYQPEDITGIVGLGGIAWTNQGTRFHDATTMARPSWLSISLDAGESGDTQFLYAGTFTFTCTYHLWMEGTLRIAPRVEPPGGIAGDHLRIVGAVGDPADAGFAFDVQRKKDTGPWRMIGRSSTESFTFDAKHAGHYRFRVRLVDVATDLVSAWSPKRLVTVAAR